MPLADILKARIQTFGVEEHPLRMETALTGAHDTLCVHVDTIDFFLITLRIEGHSAMEDGQLWSIIDVGGSRALRGA